MIRWNCDSCESSGEFEMVTEIGNADPRVAFEFQLQTNIWAQHSATAPECINRTVSVHIPALNIEVHRPAKYGRVTGWTA